MQQMEPGKRTTGTLHLTPGLREHSPWGKVPNEKIRQEKQLTGVVEEADLEAEEG